MGPILALYAEKYLPFKNAITHYEKKNGVSIDMNDVEIYSVPTYKNRHFHAADEVATVIRECLNLSRDGIFVIKLPTRFIVILPNGAEIKKIGYEFRIKFSFSPFLESEMLDFFFADGVLYFYLADGVKSVAPGHPSWSFISYMG